MLSAHPITACCPQGCAGPACSTQSHPDKAAGRLVLGVVQHTLCLLLYLKEGVFFLQARVIPFFLPCIMDRLQDADSDVRAVSLQILSSLLQILDGFKPSFMALELAGKLPTLLCDVRMVGSPAH